MGPRRLASHVHAYATDATNHPDNMSTPSRLVSACIIAFWREKTGGEVRLEVDGGKMGWSVADEWSCALRFSRGALEQC